MAYLVLGIGTDIGKSFVVENLCRILPNTTAIKPVCTGFSDDDKNSDPARILTALGLEISQKNLDKISPWRFEEPCSPHFLKEQINFAKVVEFCQQNIAQHHDQTLLIEAAGGVMTPINNQKTFLDLATELRIPILLISGNYLGAISHTLSAVEALKNHQVVIEKIIVNERENSSHSLVATIENFSKIRTISLQDFLKNPSLPHHSEPVE